MKLNTAIIGSNFVLKGYLSALKKIRQYRLKIIKSIFNLYSILSFIRIMIYITLFTNKQFAMNSYFY